MNDEDLELAHRWCATRGPGWCVIQRLGAGATASVFELNTPDGLRALKLYAESFSSGEKGKIESKRIDEQVALKNHDCPFLIQVYEGGSFENRLYLLMSRAPGGELEKRLSEVPRNKIRLITHQVATAVVFLRTKGRCHRDIKTANIFVSHDFEHATLLDLSVTRNVYDPVGLGTDHDGQLPILATARYSPPEYLFRLLKPGPELWHALDVYQLGALLHDLIMKRPMFEAEFAASADNRYRFAWIVATAPPLVQASDVDQDLIFLARRALDKDWKRRSSLRLEDFLAESKTQEANALRLLGFAADRRDLLSPNASARLGRLRTIVEQVERAVSEHLRAQKITATHVRSSGSQDHSRLITFSWEASPVSTQEIEQHRIALQLEITLNSERGSDWFQTSAELNGMVDGTHRRAYLELPNVRDDENAVGTLAEQIASTIPVLAVNLVRANFEIEKV